MQIYADKRAAILKFDIRKNADRKRAIFRRIPARRVYPTYYFLYYINVCFLFFFLGVWPLKNKKKKGRMSDAQH